MSDSTPPLFGELLVQLGLCTPNQVQEALALQSHTAQRVGEALVSLGYVTRDQLEMALMEALGLRQPEHKERPRLGELLIRLKHITAQQLEAGLMEHRQSGRRLGEVLVEMGACTYAQIYEALRLQQVGRGSDEQKAPAKAAGQLRVLVVDDSPLALGVVQSGLEERGYDVHCFGEPYEALEAVFRIKPDIVLSDLDMPGMSGADLCRRLKDGPARAVPVIILTANDREAERVGGLRAGADDYVSKGASMDELSARIESVARRTGETERMRKLFARYTSAAVVEEILKAPGEIVLTGEKREVTLLFADIRNFTSMSETLPAEQVVEVLNAVLGRLAEAVLTCGGTLDKFLGDGLMAVFGAPVTHSDDALRALQSARMMMQAVAELNETVRTCLAEKKSPHVDSIDLQLGIGINTGMVVAGNLGSAQRTEYTCIGDAVNVAARLCAVAGPGEVLVGQRTRALAPGAGLFEDLPPVRLKGKAQPVPLFRLLWSPGAVVEGSSDGVA